MAEWLFRQSTPYWSHVYKKRNTIQSILYSVFHHMYFVSSLAMNPYTVLLLLSPLIND